MKIIGLEYNYYSDEGGHNVLMFPEGTLGEDQKDFVREFDRVKKILEPRYAVKSPKIATLSTPLGVRVENLFDTSWSPICIGYISAYSQDYDSKSESEAVFGVFRLEDGRFVIASSATNQSGYMGPMETNSAEDQKRFEALLSESMHSVTYEEEDVKRHLNAVLESGVENYPLADVLNTCQQVEVVRAGGVREFVWLLLERTVAELEGSR